MATRERDSPPQVEKMPDGRTCYVSGKNKIIITEHFPTDGSTLEDLFVDLILRKFHHESAQTCFTDRNNEEAGSIGNI